MWYKCDANDKLKDDLILQNKMREIRKFKDKKRDKTIS